MMWLFTGRNRERPSEKPSLEQELLERFSSHLTEQLQNGLELLRNELSQLLVDEVRRQDDRIEKRLERAYKGSPGDSLQDAPRQPYVRKLPGRRFFGR